MGKTFREPWPEDNMDGLLRELETPVTPDPAFRQALLAELQHRLHAQHAQEHQSTATAFPEGLCPFTDFCYADLPLPMAMRAACPCLKAQPLLQQLADRGIPIQTRPCRGLAIRAERANA